MSNLGVSSFWTIPLGYVITLFHHGYLFRDLRRDPKLPIRRVYKFLFPCLVLVWLAGGATSIFSAVNYYYMFEYRGGSIFMVGIAQLIGAGMALVETGMMIVIWVKCAKFKSSVHASEPMGDFDKAGTKV
ncbi:unnamed protein product [Rhizoctonia solani]|uniref:Uncharacterized protein n=1 Tax=Rhizoctonia solani TaxID=456999 RepID=A0A8H3HHW6_9AGAM|nr:unnamed protein product [Rhizoctonia solani]CAE6533196.1 unnamed protein product [Rhizoctonia solani]